MHIIHKIDKKESPSTGVPQKFQSKGKNIVWTICRNVYNISLMWPMTSFILFTESKFFSEKFPFKESSPKNAFSASLSVRDFYFITITVKKKLDKLIVNEKMLFRCAERGTIALFSRTKHRRRPRSATLCRNESRVCGICASRWTPVTRCWSPLMRPLSPAGSAIWCSWRTRRTPPYTIIRTLTPNEVQLSRRLDSTSCINKHI